MAMNLGRIRFFFPSVWGRNRTKEPEQFRGRGVKDLPRWEGVLFLEIQKDGARNLKESRRMASRRIEGKRGGGGHVPQKKINKRKRKRKIALGFPKYS